MVRWGTTCAGVPPTPTQVSETCVGAPTTLLTNTLKNFGLLRMSRKKFHEYLLLLFWFMLSCSPMKHEIKVGTVEVVASNEVGGEDNVPMGMLEDASYEAQCEAQGYYPE